MTNAIFLSGLSKSFGTVQAVENLDLSVSQGEAICLLGPNGAGKSTTINLLLGLTTPDGGTVKIFNSDPKSKTARARIGVVAQDCDFPTNLTTRELIALVRAHYTNPRSESELIGNFQLDDIADRQTGGFSGGQQRRLALALAFAGNGDLLFLDEPTTGLDADARRNFWNYIKIYQAEGGTLMVTTHHLAEIETIADRICLINHGKVEIEGTVNDIKRRIGQKKLTFRCAQLPNLSPIAELSSTNGTHTLTSPDVDSLMRQLVKSGVEFSDLEIAPVSLEEAIEKLILAGREAK